MTKKNIQEPSQLTLAKFNAFVKEYGIEMVAKAIVQQCTERDLCAECPGRNTCTNRADVINDIGKGQTIIY